MCNKADFKWLTLSNAKLWPNYKGFKATNMAQWSWGRHEALKYDKVIKRKTCMWSGRISTNDFLHQVLCVMISTQHKRKEECFLATYLSKLTPQPSSILQVSLSNNALNSDTLRIYGQIIVDIMTIVQLSKRPTVIPLNCSKLCRVVKFSYLITPRFISGKI